MNNNINEILIVDDTPANIKLLSQILSSHGYKIRVALSGSQALTSVELARPDLILLDIKMPDMNGFEVCRQLKANSKSSQIPVIFISALNDLQDKLQGFHVGGLDYISKPFQIEEVLARVKSHLYIRRAQQILQENNDRMQRELKLAWHLQMNFLPQKFPDVPNWQFSAALQPARETSGDFYDLFKLPDNRIVFLIADVVDKGVAAALLMVLAWSLLRERIAVYPDHPEKVFFDVNKSILSILKDLEFVTVFLGILEPGSGKMVYANAGHNPPLWFRDGRTNPKQLGRTGLPLGVSEDFGWSQSEIMIEPDDILLVYTDGVTEACNQMGDYVGLQHLVECVQPLILECADDLKMKILNELDSFLGKEPPQDDITLMVIKRLQE
ncbi:MAG: SpoIIE family protein phosphatase [Anaerolineaceae bacterium]|nr:SpoIIE family protein phosphatase [Anaerolineaceae bacterium]